MVRRFIDLLLRSLPARCEVCHAWPAQVICAACMRVHRRPQHRCLSCALPLPASQLQCGACLRRPSPLDQCIAAVSYAYPWSACVTRFKYGKEPGWAEPLARMLREAPGAQETIRVCDGLIAMPLANARLRERGFNQALELARRLAPEKTRDQWLLRVRDTPPQSSLSLEERLGNVKGAFMVAPGHLESVKGKRLTLVDDVMTSGASLFAAATALRLAGAGAVSALVFARTDRPH